MSQIHVLCESFMGSSLYIELTRQTIVYTHITCVADMGNDLLLIVFLSTESDSCIDIPMQMDEAFFLGITVSSEGFVFGSKWQD